MLIVAGVIDVPPEAREEFLASRLESIHRSRAETGCVEYSFAADAVEPGRVRIFEIWESRADLEVHQQVMAAQPPPAGVPLLQREITAYELADGAGR